MRAFLNKRTLRAGAVLAGLAFAALMSAPAQAQDGKRPALVITNKPMGIAKPKINKPSSMGVRPTRSPEITADDVVGADYFSPSETIVARKVAELENDLNALDSRVAALSGQLSAIEDRNQSQAAEYFASTATISTQLQTGTTPGNPRLVQKLSTAQRNLDDLSENVADLNALAVEVANAASMGAFLQEAARSTYGLSGAVEEDHARLAALEDQINGSIVNIDRLLNDVNDDITRTASYLASERSNLRTLALGISNGDLYGRSLSNRPFSTAPGSLIPASTSSDAGMTRPSSSRPLVKIRFDRPDVDFEQPVYMAVNEAMERYPEARFEVIAVHPNTGNAAQVAIESTRARRNAERVLRTLTQMGLPMERVDLSYTPSAEATTNEVHVFIR